MSAFSELINVKFEDASSYASSYTGDKVLCPFFHFWGPVDQFTAMNSTQFHENYQMSLPVVGTSTYSAIMAQVKEGLTPWVQLHRALQAGASTVCAYRIKPTCHIVWTWDGSTLDKETTGPDTTKAFYGLKYPGVPTYADLMLTEGVTGASMGVNVTYDSTSKIYTFEVNAVVGSTTTNVETVQLTADDIASQSLPVLNANFEYTEIISKDILLSITTATVLTDTVSADDISADLAKYTASDYKTAFTALQGKMSDPEVSDFTILLPPSIVSVAGDVETVGLQVVSERKDANFIAGTLSTDGTVSGIETYYNALRGSGSNTFFTSLIDGREEVLAFGTKYILDCTALQAGRIASTAESVNLNQLPSAKKYGAVNAVLKTSKTFSEVLALHDKGINSVYISTTGPCIFGIKSVYNIQTSYWAKLNISRVAARIIKNVTPLVMNVIHTPVVSDPIERAKLQVALSQVIDEQIAARNLKPESYANCGDDINTDKLTRGGEVLNIILTCYFKKLAERVNIKIIATDSSVDVQLS